MFKSGYAELKKAIEAERLRIRAIKDRGTYGTEYLCIITPNFVTKYKSTALIKLSRDLSLDQSSEAGHAKTIVDAELAVRREQTIWLTIRDNTAWIFTISGVALTFYLWLSN